jgi:AraC-like DNA-binding protein
VLASFTRRLLSVGELLGVPREAMLAHARLAERDVEDPDGRVPLERQAAIWESISQHTDAPVGLMLGQNASPDMLGVVGRAARQQPTVGAAFELLSRCRRLVGGPILGLQREEAGEVVFYKHVPLRYLRVRHCGEAFAGATLGFMKSLAGEQCAPRWVRLQHPAPADLAPLEEAFGCPIEFMAAETAIAFDASALRRPILDDPDPKLSLCVERADALLSREGEEPDLAERARRALLEELRGGVPTADRVARKLALSKRTLQRRLQEKGVEFSRLLDEARRELALLYLREQSLAAYEVAWLLGYTEPTAFIRAFKRWTGKTPREVRELAA